MSGEDRFRLAIEMSLFARSLAESRIRLEHPEWPETKVVREWIRLSFLPEPLPPGLRDSVRLRSNSSAIVDIG